MGNLLAVHEADAPIREIDVHNALTIASAETGAIALSGYFSEKEIDAMANEATRWQTALVARGIKEWPRTKRATFFTMPEEATVYLDLASRALRSNRFMPATTTLMTEMSNYVRSYGRRHNCQPLAGYEPNRIGVNIMNGTPSRPAEIPAHTDPKAESGLVAVIELGDGKSRTQVTGNITFILGFDTCNHYGIEQFEHSVTSTYQRYSITAAHLTES